MPAIVPLLEKEYRNAAARLEATQEELNDLHPDKSVAAFCPFHFSLDQHLPHQPCHKGICLPSKRLLAMRKLSSATHMSMHVEHLS